MSLFAHRFAGARTVCALQHGPPWHWSQEGRVSKDGHGPQHLGSCFETRDLLKRTGVSFTDIADGTPSIEDVFAALETAADCPSQP
jgi:hypothetical protein